MNGINCEATDEADGRILLHADDMMVHGAKSVVIRATDTDVVVLAVANFFELASKGLAELWLLFGAGKNMRCIYTILFRRK